MSVGLFTLILVGIAALVVLAVVAIGYMGDSSRGKVREANRSLKSSKAREKIAVSALRSISNNAGNPALEAQIALDQIENLYQKELES